MVECPCRKPNWWSGSIILYYVEEALKEYFFKNLERIGRRLMGWSDVGSWGGGVAGSQD
jgi:hypothetical protein